VSWLQRSNPDGTSHRRRVLLDRLPGAFEHRPFHGSPEARASHRQTGAGLWDLRRRHIRPQRKLQILRGRLLASGKLPDGRHVTSRLRVMRREPSWPEGRHRLLRLAMPPQGPLRVCPSQEPREGVRVVRRRLHSRPCPSAILLGPLQSTSHYRSRPRRLPGTKARGELRASRPGSRDADVPHHGKGLATTAREVPRVVRLLRRSIRHAHTGSRRTDSPRWSPRHREPPARVRTLQRVQERPVHHRVAYRTNVQVRAFPSRAPVGRRPLAVSQSPESGTTSKVRWRRNVARQSMHRYHRVACALVGIGRRRARCAV
jgi:hypothetical protein